MIKIDLQNVEPVGDRVLVKPHETENEIEGFVIPDNAKEKPCTGEVLAVGPGTSDFKMTFKKGDIVLFGRYAGSDLELNQTKLLVIRGSDIALILNRSEE